jgi:Uma2 family endonuclease
MAQKAPTGPGGAAEQPAPLRMTYEEFLEWANEDTRAEWVNGEVVWMSPVSDPHQDLGGWLFTLLFSFVDDRKLGKIRYENYQMKTGPDLPGRQPDILYVASEHVSRFKGTHLEGPADIVIEIVSPDSRGRDRGDKFAEYEAGGVPEYWILDQPRRQAEFNLLGPDGRYHLAPIGEDGIFHSRALPGFWLKVDWLWQDPLPSVREVLRELGVE